MTGKKCRAGRRPAPQGKGQAGSLPYDGVALLGEFAAGGGDAGGVELEVGEEFGAFAVLDELIGDAEALQTAGV